MDQPTRFPLAWPTHKPRTPSYLRKEGAFKHNGSPITRTKAMKRVEAEVARLGGSYPLLSSDYQTRKDGSELARAREPADPGVCLYFTMGGKPFAMACDAYKSNAMNIAAIAAHLDATRAIERHGVATAAETLQAFTALPSNSTPPPRSWREVLGFTPHFPEGLSVDEAKTVLSGRYRERAKILHAQGDSEGPAMVELNAARDGALREISR